MEIHQKQILHEVNFVSVSVWEYYREREREREENVTNILQTLCARCHVMLFLFPRCIPDTFACLLPIWGWREECLHKDDLLQWFYARKMSFVFVM